jgi:anti-anti-sigma factor
MDMKVVSDNNRVTLKLNGRFDCTVGMDYMMTVAGAIHRHPDADFEVDLAGVDYIDSSGISKLIVLNKQMQEKGRRLVVSNAQPAVRRILTTMHLADLMAVGT